MIKKVAILSLLSISYAVLASAEGAPHNPPPQDFTKNQLIVAASDKNVIDYFIAGTGPDTLATELLGYMKAGVASGLTVQTAFPQIQAQSYKSGNLSATDSTAANVMPPMSITMRKSTDIWPQWSVVYTNAEISIHPSSDDGATIAKLMDAAGVQPTKSNSGLPGVSLRYAGKNIICIADTTSETDKNFKSATCWLNMKN